MAFSFMFLWLFFLFFRIFFFLSQMTLFGMMLSLLVFLLNFNIFIIFCLLTMMIMILFNIFLFILFFILTETFLNYLLSCILSWFFGRLDNYFDFKVFGFVRNSKCVILWLINFGRSFLLFWKKFLNFLNFINQLLICKIIDLRFLNI